MKKAEKIGVSVTIENIGDYAGDEVVQLYLHDEVCSVVRPSKELKGFKRVNLKQGEKKRIDFELSERDFAYWHEGEWIAESGRIIIMTGSDSENLKDTYFDYLG